jgi:hypothetical protein
MAKQKKEEVKTHGYKVKNIISGLYLKSFHFDRISWSKNGKIWSHKGYISSSINSAISNSRRYKSILESVIINDIGNWEIVELQESNSYPLAFILDKIKT